MVEIPLLWKLQIRGAEDVKQRFQEINEQFAKGEISASQYAKELRGVNRDSRALTNTMNMQKNIYLATHPSLLNLTRAMSTMASVARTMLSIQNALNLTRIAGNSLSSEEAQLLIQLAESKRRMLAIDQSTVEGKQAYQNELEIQRIMEERLAAIRTENMNQAISEAINFAASLALISNQVTQMIPKLVQFGGALKGIKDTLMAISFLQVPLLATLGTVAAFAAVFLGAYFGAMLLFDALGLTKLSLGDLEYFYWSTIEPFFANMVDFFTVKIPLALGQMGAFFADMFVNQIPAWLQQLADSLVKGFTDVWNTLGDLARRGLEYIGNQILRWVSEVRSIIQSLVNWFNSLIFSPTVSSSSSSSGSSSFAGMQGSAVINALHSAHGFEGTVTKPTMFMVGEEGPESVSVLPHTTRSGNMMGGSGITIIVQGSVISERELMKTVDRYLKDQLKSIGFT